MEEAVQKRQEEHLYEDDEGGATRDRSKETKAMKEKNRV